MRRKFSPEFKEEVVRLVEKQGLTVKKSHLPFLVFFSALLLVAARPAPLRWIVYYGTELSPEMAQKLDVAILDASQIDARPLKNGHTRFFGYLSVGEADSQRDYWISIKDKKFILSQDPEWKNAYRMDVRSAEWQSFLLDHLIPQILDKGYDGLFLDTIDTATELEENDPVKYAGAKKAIIDFVVAIKKRYPHVLLLPNNGLEFLAQYGNLLEGVAVEDLYTIYDAARAHYQKTPFRETRAREHFLDLFKKQFHKPVFNILYEKSVRTPLARYAIKRSRDKGYLWYLTTVDLMQPGVSSY